MTTAYDKAIDYLSRREHSRLELKRKLRNKDFSSEEIDETLTKLTEKKYQSDERFAESYVRYRKQSGFGPLKIIAELRERGVAESIISTAVDMHSGEWHEQLINVWKKKFSDPNKEKAKQGRFLFSRGYSAESISKLLK